MEIERKWMVNGWPEGLPLKEEFAMRQGYISVRPPSCCVFSFFPVFPYLHYCFTSYFTTGIL